MWREEEDRFVRAPVPAAFDKLVEKLQDNDSVLWESISLGSARDSESGVPDDLKFLMERIRELETQNMEKDNASSNLKREIKVLRESERRRSAQGPRECNDAEFYKQKFEHMKNQYDKLREVLAANGRLTRVNRRAVSAVRM